MTSTLPGHKPPSTFIESLTGQHLKKLVRLRLLSTCRAAAGAWPDVCRVFSNITHGHFSWELIPQRSSAISPILWCVCTFLSQPAIRVRQHFVSTSSKVPNHHHTKSTSFLLSLCPVRHCQALAMGCPALNRRGSPVARSIIFMYLCIQIY
jgi:hypothetical protein